MNAPITWLLEADFLDELHNRLASSAKELGHRVREWSGSLHNEPEGTTPGYTIFHGSLGLAAEVARSHLWRPGAFCDVERFRCTAWYPGAARWLAHRDWVSTTVQEFVDNPRSGMRQLGAVEQVFVRPDSPLKPFSGRVLDHDKISLRALDHGFYYEETDLPIVLAPIISIGREWRFVVVDHQVVASSPYVAEGREGKQEETPKIVIDYASQIAAELEEPDPVYVMDIAESDGDLRLLELNPFSGADLYNCDTQSVVSAIDRYVVSIAMDSAGS